MIIDKDKLLDNAHCEMPLIINGSRLDGVEIKEKDKKHKNKVCHMCIKNHIPSNIDENTII